MIKNQDMQILSHLRNDARISLTNLSRKTGIPVSTIFEKIRQHECSIIKKHTALIDFARLGYATRANIALKVDKNARDSISSYLEKHQNVNSVYKVTNGYDFLVEGIFRNFMDLENFTEALEERFKVRHKQVYYIIEDIKREGFMAVPGIIEIMN